MCNAFEPYSTLTECQGMNRSAHSLRCSALLFRPVEESRRKRRGRTNERKKIEWKIVWCGCRQYRPFAYSLRCHYLFYFILFHFSSARSEQKPRSIETKCFCIWRWKTKDWMRKKNWKRSKKQDLNWTWPARLPFETLCMRTLSPSFSPSLAPFNHDGKGAHNIEKKREENWIAVSGRVHAALPS